MNIWVIPILLIVDRHNPIKSIVHKDDPESDSHFTPSNQPITTLEAIAHECVLTYQITLGLRHKMISTPS